MDIAISILAVVAGIIGIIGSILPGLPGPPVSWIGMLVLYIWGTGTNSAGEPMSLKTLLVWLAVMIVVTVVDYFVPMYFTKLTGGSKYAERGAMAGLVIGIFLTPIGMILGAFLGAFLSELYYNRKGASQALKAAMGSFLGFITGTGLKTIAACMMMWQIIVYL
ncbi:MAG: DUF456 domain-containing protein [Candidatus Cryptobacteroides sp.]